jgi:hypothetical protein
VRGPSIALWHVPGAPDDADALTSLFRDGAGCTVESMPTMRAWAASGADVLVLRGAAHTGCLVGDPFVAAHDFTVLRKRRVIGIGGEAARAFGALGLEIWNGHERKFSRARVAVVLQAGGLVPASRAGKRITAFTGGRDVACGALHLPAAGDLAPRLDVIARCASDPNYAPIARQGNFVLCGVGADARTWSDAFRALVGQLAIALAGRPPEETLPLEWPTDAPGAYDVELAPACSVGAPYERTYRFRFDRPVRFAAEAELVSGGATMLLFQDERMRTRVGRRLDGAAGEKLRIDLMLDAAAVGAARGRYWALDVSNFDTKSAARCRLTIRVAPK